MSLFQDKDDMEKQRYKIYALIACAVIAVVLGRKYIFPTDVDSMESKLKLSEDVTSLENEMYNAVKSENYEMAAKIRDKINKIKGI